MSAAAFEPVFQALRDILITHAGGLVIARDAPGDLVVHTPDRDSKGRPVWFAALKTGRAYVACHLPPLHDHPALAEDLPPELERRRQGKTCFNFRQQDPAAFAALDRLAAAVRAAV